MSFKIVLVSESLIEMIVAVPHLWEINDMLLWPRTAKMYELDKLRCNAESVPSFTWKKQKCKLKLDEIQTFEEALRLEEYYSNSEQVAFTSLIRRNRENRPKNTPSTQDVNMLVNLESYVSESQLNGNQVPHIKNEPVQIEQLEFAPNAFANSSINEEKGNSNSRNIGVHNSDIEVLRKDIQQLKEQCQDLKKDNVKLNIKLDKILSGQENLLSNLVNPSSIFENEEDNSSTIFTLPISTVDEMNMLEQEMSNLNERRKMVLKLSQICGTSGAMKAHKIGLTVIKNIFTDELLINYTWRGVNGSQKLPFCHLNNIRALLTDVLSLADNTCNAATVDNFLQYSALKHCRQRLKRKLCKKFRNYEMGTSSDVKQRRDNENFEQRNSYEYDMFVNASEDNSSSADEDLNINT